MGKDRRASSGHWCPSCAGLPCPAGLVRVSSQGQHPADSAGAQCRCPGSSGPAEHPEVRQLICPCAKQLWVRAELGKSSKRSQSIAAAALQPGWKGAGSPQPQQSCSSAGISPGAGAGARALIWLWGCWGLVFPPLPPKSHIQHMNIAGPRLLHQPALMFSAVAMGTAQPITAARGPE